MAVVTVQYFEGCPNWRVLDERLRRLRAELGFTLEYERVETAKDAARLGFVGSPTMLVDGIDPFATGDAATGLACRLYATDEGPRGAPTEAALRAAIS